MIEWIEGRVVEEGEGYVVIEKNGIGLKLLLSTNAKELCKLGKKVKIYTYFGVQNEKFSMWGFKDKEEKDFFTLLLNVGGIGPSTAIKVVSNISFEEFRSSIIEGNVEALAEVRGIGKKRAYRLAIELKEKYKNLARGSPLRGEAVKALINLGIEGSKARELVRKVKGESVEEIVKKVLRELV